MKVELGIELRGDLTLEEERFLKSQIDDKQEKTRNLQRWVDNSTFLRVVSLCLHFSFFRFAFHCAEHLRKV